MDITVNISEEEKQLVITAIAELNKVYYITHMTQMMIAKHAGIKATKVRAILIELIKEQRITQYLASDNPRIQRFYYTVAEFPESSEAQ